MEDVLFQCFIDLETWDAGRWKAVAYFVDPSGAHPPCLGIVFEDIKAGKQIFSDWHRRLGNVDRYEELRISIVEGEILGEEPGYSLHISSDPSHVMELARMNGVRIEANRAVVMSRFKRMLPAPGSLYLSRFKQSFARHRKYFLIPVSADVKPVLESAIEKTEIHFRQASEIAGDDRDAVVFPEHYFDGDGAIH